MNPKLLPAILCGACALLALESFFASRSQAQGNLAPPAGPAPTMVSLADLAGKVDAVQARLDDRLPGGKNLAVAASNGYVSAWDHHTDTWTDFLFGGVIGPLNESDGNFLFINSTGSAVAWSSVSRTWTPTNFPGAVITQSGGSRGNFFISTNTGAVAAWNKTTEEWTGLVIGGVIGTPASSEGNYMYTSNNGVAAVWNQATGAWTTKAFSGFLIPIGSD